MARKHATVPHAAVDDAVYEARWQADFDALRRRSPSRWGRWIRPRLSFANPWLARLYGGAFLWLGWVVISRDMLPAPLYARQYILAQMWRHACHGRFLADLGIFLCTGAMTFLIHLAGSDLVSLVIGLGALVLLVWSHRAERDHEVDESVSRLIGRRGVQAGIFWVVSQKLDSLTPENKERLSRMGWGDDRTKIGPHRTAQRVDPTARGNRRSRDP